VVGLLGPRQCGKSTVLRDLLKLGTPASLDDLELKEEARRSPKAFLARNKETARVGKGDQRFNHWTAVRNGLMNAHADLFAQIPAIARMLPDEIDQMKLFELIQIIPTPTRAALASGNFGAHRVTSARIMGYLRNNSMFAFGKADRAKKSASFHEILDAMWLFAPKFERARAKFAEIKAQERGGGR
jgi:hypothetical protein